MLPAISKHADLILLADIEPKLHQHTQHLLDCFYKSDSPNEFLKNYTINNPIENMKTRECFANGYNSILTIPVLKNMLSGERGYIADSLKQYHFLSTPECFNACKQAAAKLAFTHINLNLLDENECGCLGSMLKNSNAILTVCNFTNIHDYDKHNKVNSSTNLLLDGSFNYCIIYSTNRGTSSHVTNNIEDYFNKVNPNITLNDDFDDSIVLIPCHNQLPSS